MVHLRNTFQLGLTNLILSGSNGLWFATNDLMVHLRFNLV